MSGFVRIADRDSKIIGSTVSRGPALRYRFCILDSVFVLALYLRLIPT